MVEEKAKIVFRMSFAFQDQLGKTQSHRLYSGILGYHGVPDEREPNKHQLTSDGCLYVQRITQSDDRANDLGRNLSVIVYKL